MRHPLKVSDVMTRDVITVTEDTPYKDVVSVLAENHISAVPVLNRYGGVGGVVSETDLVRKEEFQGSRRPPCGSIGRGRGPLPCGQPSCCRTGR